MSENEQTERLTITADGAKAVQEYERLKKSIREKGETIKKISSISRELTEKEIQAIERLVNAQHQEQKALDMTGQKLQQLGIHQRRSVQNTEQMTRAGRQHNFMIMGLAGAIDDFVTVSQMQDWSVKGMIAGTAAAANNLSVVLAMINPWLSIIPPVVSAIFRLGYAFTQTGDEAEESGKKVKKAAGDYEDALKALENFRLANIEAGEGRRAVERDTKEKTFEGAMKGIDEQAAKIEAQRQAAEKLPKFIGGQGGLGVDVWQPPMPNKERQEALLKAKMDRDALEKQRDELREQHKADLKRFDDESDRLKREEEKQKRLKQLGNAKNQVVQTIGQMFAAGQNEQAIRAKITGALGGIVGADQAGGDVIDELIKEGQSESVQNTIDNIMSGKGPKSAEAERKRAEAKAAELEARRAESDRKVPRGIARRKRELARQLGVAATDAEVAATEEQEGAKANSDAILLQILAELKRGNNANNKPVPPVPGGNN